MHSGLQVKTGETNFLKKTHGSTVMDTSAALAVLRDISHFTLIPKKVYRCTDKGRAEQLTSKRKHLSLLVHHVAFYTIIR